MKHLKRFEIMEGESIILEQPKHWKNYIFPFAESLLFFILAAIRASRYDCSLVNRLMHQAIINEKTQVLLSVIECVTLVLLLFKQIKIMIDVAYTRYYVTNRRVVSVAGFLEVNVLEMMTNRIETVSMKQSAYERLFSSGDILLVSAGATVYLDDVYDARDFKQKILEQLSKEKES